ncbi:M20 family metallopeptidase [Anaerolineales bacterium HSG6]|nr:M20 family metallopeptidase [Anaerolineales bacterium HSG6]MDM8530262.1 M20 family metallopeptidase [Anaerolineales bacterium HSG25]
MNQILDYLKPLQDEMVERLAQWVNQESPTYHKPAVDAMGQMTMQSFLDTGAELTTTHHQTDYGDHYTLAYGQGTGQILTLNHFDTVWPLGEASRRPFTIEDGHGKGPGVHDMKAGTLINLYALRAIHDLQLKPRHKLVYLLTSDEEVSSPTSRSIIEAEGRRSNYCFVHEGAINRGITIARKGVGRFQLAVTGVAAHAGIEPEKGVSAIEELARQTQYLHGLTDLNKGVSVNVGVISGGERPNVIAPHATAEIDLRITHPVDEAGYVEKIGDIRPALKGSQLSITGGMSRPPWPETMTDMDLFEKAKAISAQLGFPTERRLSGGGSDGSFVAAMGVPTLDGLGSIGGGAHALTEHTVLDMLPIRAALTAELIMAL